MKPTQQKEDYRILTDNKMKPAEVEFTVKLIREYTDIIVPDAMNFPPAENGTPKRIFLSTHKLN